MTDLPDPRDFVDESWEERERDLVAHYLEQYFSPWASFGWSHWICGKTEMPS